MAKTRFSRGFGQKVDNAYVVKVVPDWGLHFAIWALCQTPSNIHIFFAQNNTYEKTSKPFLWPKLLFVNFFLPDFLPLS